MYNSSLNTHKRKKTTTLTIDEDLLIKAKEMNINISQTTCEALERELIAVTGHHYTKGLENQISLYKRFLIEKQLSGVFEEWKMKLLDI